MGEIMRWNLTRLPQRRVPKPEAVLSLRGPVNLRQPLLDGDQAALKDARAAYSGVLADGTALRRYLSTGKGGASTTPDARLTPIVSSLFGSLLILDEWLAAAAPVPPASPPYTTPAINDL